MSAGLVPKHVPGSHYLHSRSLTQEHTMIRSSDWTTTQVVFVPQFNTHMSSRTVPQVNEMTVSETKARRKEVLTWWVNTMSTMKVMVRQSALRLTAKVPI
jgi:hypothetical protein